MRHGARLDQNKEGVLILSWRGLSVQSPRPIGKLCAANFHTWQKIVADLEARLEEMILEVTWEKGED